MLIFSKIRTLTVCSLLAFTLTHTPRIESKPSSIQQMRMALNEYGKVNAKMLAALGEAKKRLKTNGKSLKPLVKNQIAWQDQVNADVFDMATWEVQPTDLVVAIEARTVYLDAVK